MANPGDKPASRGVASSLGTLVLAILLLAFGFWAGRTFETLWPSQRPAPPTSMAGATVPPSTMGSPEPSPSASPSGEPSPDASPSPETTTDVAAAGGASRPARRAARRAGAASPEPGLPAPVAPVPVAAALPGGRPFVLGISVVESLKPSDPDVPGFQPGGVGVKRAPEIPGRVDFEVSPPQVKAGDRYAVKVFLVNDGGKPIAIDGLNVAMVADGRRSARDMPPRARNVAPRERALLAELPGVWQDGLDSWALEVAVTSKRQDRYTNTLNWK
ncbi:MAG TPA: hypothetical protein VMT87_08815 [Vicinamibacteria bacterium]|nr:hypothetical protein [Vicinamibacteria bacterium]